MSAVKIVEALLGDVAITALIGNRAALVQLKQNPIYPALVYSFPAETPLRNLAGDKPERMDTTVQINPLAKTIDEVIAIHAAVRSVFEMGAGTVAGQKVVGIERDFIGGFSKDNALGLWTQPVDYEIQHYE